VPLRVTSSRVGKEVGSTRNGSVCSTITKSDNPQRWEKRFTCFKPARFPFTITKMKETEGETQKGRNLVYKKKHGNSQALRCWHRQMGAIVFVNQTGAQEEGGNGGEKRVSASISAVRR